MNATAYITHTSITSGTTCLSIFLLLDIGLVQVWGYYKKKSQAGSALPGQSHIGLKTMNCKILTWAKTKNQMLNWLSHSGTLVIEFYEFLNIFWIIKPFIRYMNCKHFLTFSRLPFHFVDGFLCWAEALYFDVVPLVSFCFIKAFVFGIRFKIHR